MQQISALCEVFFLYGTETAYITSLRRTYFS